MSGWVADAVGLAGSATMVAAFVYSNLARAMDLVLFNLLNLVGALLLMASLWVHFNLASMALELVWAAIAAAGLGRAAVARARP